MSDEANKQSGPIRASELMAKLENDEEYQRRSRELDLEAERIEAEAALEEQHIVADIRAAGVDVGSVWDLSVAVWPYPKALPVLMRHFERGGYTDALMEALGVALAVKQSDVFWERLKACYLSPRSPGEAEGAAQALAGCANATHLDDLTTLVNDEERGDSRIFLLRAIGRIGRERGRVLLQRLQTHPVLGTEATAILEGRGRGS